MGRCCHHRILGDQKPFVFVFVMISVPGPSGPLAVPRLCVHVAGGGGQEEHASGTRLPQRGQERREGGRHAQAL